MEKFSTAREMQAALHSRLNSMVNRGVPTRIYGELAKISGVSATRIRYFHQGQRPNLMPTTLDDLASAITMLERLET